MRKGPLLRCLLREGDCAHMESRFPFFFLPFLPHFSEKGTPQFLRLMFLHGFLIKMMNEPRIGKKRQMVFGLCIVLEKCIFHCRS